MGTTTHGGNLISIPVAENSRAQTRRKELATKRRRRMTPETGRAIEILGHAIEYLADEHALECLSRHDRLASGTHPRVLAIELLMARNREVYFSCPEVPSLGERLRSILRLQRA